jgi:Yip1 domain
VAVDVSLFLYRLIGASLLDSSMYEGIEADRTRTGTLQALATVVLSSLAAGFGASKVLGNHLWAFALVTALALVTWLAWSMLTFQIGTRLLPEADTRADWPELLRTIGFAAAPGLLQGFAILPGLAIPVFVVTGVWMFVAMVVAVRHALDYTSTRRAMAVCGLAGLLSVALAVCVALAIERAVS